MRPLFLQSVVLMTGMDWDRARQRDVIRQRGAESLRVPKSRPGGPTAPQLAYIKQLCQQLRMDVTQPQTVADASQEIDRLRLVLAERRRKNRRRGR